MGSPTSFAGLVCRLQVTSRKATAAERGVSTGIFLAIARGSTLEVQTQLLMARELGFGESKNSVEAESLSEEVSNMLYSLMSKL